MKTSTDVVTNEDSATGIQHIRVQIAVNTTGSTAYTICQQGMTLIICHEGRLSFTVSGKKRIVLRGMADLFFDCHENIDLYGDSKGEVVFSLLLLPIHSVESLFSTDTHSRDFIASCRQQITGCLTSVPLLIRDFPILLAFSAREGEHNAHHLSINSKVLLISFLEQSVWQKRETMLRQTGRRKADNLIALERELFEDPGAVGTIGDYAEKYGSTPALIQTHFKERFGYPFGQFVLKLRMDRALEWIKTTDWSLEQISHRLGYAHLSSFSAVFRKKWGVPPIEFRRRKAS